MYTWGRIPETSSECSRPLLAAIALPCIRVLLLICLFLSTCALMRDPSIMEPSTSPRNINPLHQHYSSRKSLRWVVFLVIGALAVILLSGQSYAPDTIRRSSKAKARYLSPAKLMERPISKDLQTIPKLIHQSWSSTELPAKFQRWSATCRQQHPDWEWVLWTDDDNEELVKKHFPWLLSTYQALPGVIYKADLVRNLYMYMFGG